MKQKPLILLNSSPDREHLRSKFLQSYNEWQFKNDYELKVIIEQNSIHLLRQRDVTADGFKRPIIIVDDDMLLTNETDFRKSVSFCQNSKVGIVTNGWKLSLNTKREVKDEFVKRKLVFTGGGMVLSIEAQKVIANMPKIRYWSDNVAWSIECTKAGLQNWYYRGSMAIHKVCQNGGRKALLAKTESVHHEDVVVRRGISGKMLIQSEKDVIWNDKIDKK